MRSILSFGIEQVEPMKTWITRILLAFAIFTLGFGLGKDIGLRQGAAAAPATLAEEEGDKVIVYYLHTTFRCVTCNAVEQMAKEVVERDFAEDLAEGRIEWREANFQEREDLAARYDIATSSVVVVRIEDGRETAHRRLDDVWTLHPNPDAFADYVRNTIRQHLP